MTLPTLPPDVVAHAIAVQNWMRENNYKDWKLLDLCSRATAERLETERDEAVALLREESYEHYRFTQMTEYPSVTRMLLWNMDRKKHIDAFLAKLGDKP